MLLLVVLVYACNNRKETFDNQKERLAVISTKNPTDVLIETINNLMKFYPEFDIVVIDSDSDDRHMFESIPDGVTVEYIKNKNWELGAWHYAYHKYNDYKVYMFIQDTLVPTERIIELDKDNFKEGTIYSVHYDAKIKDGGHLDELYNVYNGTNLDFIDGIDPDMKIVGMAHSSFITNKANVPTILRMEDAYIDKNITKTKVHSLLSERTGGLLADGSRRIDMTPYFKKFNGKRDY